MIEEANAIRVLGGIGYGNTRAKIVLWACALTFVLLVAFGGAFALVTPVHGYPRQSYLWAALSILAGIAALVGAIRASKRL
ncbi:MAG: hypothetical protein K0S68_705 [Candidatus Saccharibacteria bacterium]|nr:hypothetical protein [Candidatus Saccharibacteria bacterium]